MTVGATVRVIAYCTIFQSFEELKLPDAVHVDALSRDPETGALRTPDINCGRACYSYANDDKCEVVLCRVASGSASRSK